MFGTFVINMFENRSYHLKFLGTFVIFSLCFLEHSAADTEIAGVKYWARQGARFKPEYVMAQSVTRNRYTCLGLCGRMTGCISASWKPGENHCLLSSVDQTHDHWIDPIPSELIAASGWRTYSRIVYPVFHVLGPNGRYTMTFVEAEAVCQERGGNLAAPDDLLSARSMGLDECNCGWLSDNSIGFVLQQNNPGCLDWFTEGIFVCDWITTADAWCRFK